MEGVYHTEKGAPIKIGGLADSKTGQVYYALEIPDGLSLLATYNPNSIVRGLDALAPASDWPNVELVHFSFDGMVGSGFFALFVAFVFWFLYWRGKRKVPTHRLILLGILLTGPLSFLAVEFGWMVTEIGTAAVGYLWISTHDRTL